MGHSSFSVLSGPQWGCQIPEKSILAPAEAPRSLQHLQRHPSHGKNVFLVFKVCFFGVVDFFVVFSLLLYFFLSPFPFNFLTKCIFKSRLFTLAIQIFHSNPIRATGKLFSGWWFQQM